MLFNKCNATYLNFSSDGRYVNKSATQGKLLDFLNQPPEFLFNAGNSHLKEIIR